MLVIIISGSILGALALIALAMVYVPKLRERRRHKSADVPAGPSPAEGIPVAEMELRVETPGDYHLESGLTQEQPGLAARA